MPLEDQQLSQNAERAREALEKANFSGLLSASLPSVVARGRMLYQTGCVEEFSWTDGGAVLSADVRGDTDHYVVRVTPALRSGPISIACTCPYAENEGLLCKHGVAALLTIQAIRSRRFPRNLYVGPDYWEMLTEEFLEEQQEGETAVGPVVVVDLDAPHSSERYVYQPRRGQRLSYWEEPPMEVAEFASARHAKEEKRDRRFYEWFRRPSDIAIFVKFRGHFEELERRAPVQVKASSELDLVAGKVFLRRRLQDMRSGMAVEPMAPIGELLFILKNGQLAVIEEEAFPDLWPVGTEYLAAWFRSMRLGPLPVNPEEDGAAVSVDVSRWNEMNFPWPMRGKSKEPPPLRVKGLPATAVVAEPEITLDVSPDGDGTFAVRISMTVKGENLSHAQEVLAAACGVKLSLSPGFSRLSARKQALEQAIYRILSARLDRERRQVIKEIKAHPAITRILDGPGIAGAMLRQLDRMYPLSRSAASLHARGEEGEESWFMLHCGVRAAAQAALLVVSLLPEAEVVADDEDYHFSIEEKDLTRRLPALAAACQQAGVGLTVEEQAVETMQLDFAVRASRDAEQLDWFALAPEVTADGSVIPQEKWEAWMLGGMIRGEDGKLRVLSTDSAATLEKFAEILNLHAGEAQNKGRTRSALRVARLRIFDWLALRKAGVRCELPPEEAEVMEALGSFEKLPAAPLPKEIKASLRPYQKEGYDWLSFLYKNRFGACLADDMGLGKTIQTIALLAATREKGAGKKRTGRLPHLVVLPPTLLFNWRHEIETFCPALKVDELTGPQRDLDAIDADVILTTYELARRDIDVLEQRDFNVIVFDEAQAIKNLAGERSKAMRRLKGKFKLCLTGTPLENHAGEYYSILELALPGLFGDYAKFMKSLGDDRAFRPIDRARPFILRRTKEKILRELPEKTESDVWLDLTETQKVFYSRAVAEVREEVFQAFRDKTAQQAGIVALSALMRLRQICISPALIDPEQKEASPKIEYLLAKLSELEEEGHAALVFSQFTRTLDLVEKELKRQGLDFLRMDGTTPQARRKVQVANFQKGKGPAFFLISLKTGGVGLNLIRASYVFHLDPWWNPAVENQASDRAHRIGQKQRVFVNRLLMRHTVEEKMMLLKKRKRALFDQVLGGTENRSGSSLLTRDDMAWLLEA